jgi:phage terminase large subunit
MFVPRVEIPEKLVPVFTGEAMYRLAYGGRGSAKSRTFAKMAAVNGLIYAEANEPGVIVCGREYQNSLADSSFAEVKLAILSEPWLVDRYDLGDNYIRTKDKKIEFVFCGLRHNLDSIKSKARIRLLWVDEAEPVSEAAWTKTIPTVREENSEIWVTWNPERKQSATNQRFRENPPADAKIAVMNWRDNPWFPAILNKTRLEDYAKRPDQYEHVWEGEYITAQSGAYFAKPLLQAREERRIGKLSADPLMTFRAFFDIGGTGAKADHVVIWIAQFIGKEIRCLDYYEAQGQPLATHVYWLRTHGYTEDKTRVYLPHDGVNHDNVYKVTYESELCRAGFETEVIKNQGAGAANQRIEAMRRAFPFIWFNEEKCDAGIQALGWYHEKVDEVRGVGLGPDHDWCFAYGTEVLTSSGWTQIQNITVHDHVLTPLGKRSILRSGIVRETDQWIITHGIKSTPEHRFFTKRGLVMAGNLQSSEKFWTHEDWGLTILGLLCKIFRLGFMDAITLVIQEGKKEKRQYSYIEWFMSMCMVGLKKDMKSIIRMVTYSIITMKIWRPFQYTSIEANINQSLDLNAYVEYAEKHLDVIKNSATNAALNANEKIMQELSVSVEPAYSLTVDKDECYFVRMSNGAACLVANSSHCNDAAGLMAIVYEAETSDTYYVQEQERVYDENRSGWSGY